MSLKMCEIKKDISIYTKRCIEKRVLLRGMYWKGAFEKYISCRQQE